MFVIQNLPATSFLFVLFVCFPRNKENIKKKCIKYIPVCIFNLLADLFLSKYPKFLLC